MFERSFHFIPCDEPDLFDSVSTFGADAYIFDLEDAVGESEKDAALSAIQKWLLKQEKHSNLYIRVNGAEHPIAELERHLINNLSQIGVVLPKILSVNDLKLQLSFYRLQECHPVIALIEGAGIMDSVPEILGLGRLSAIAVGLEDFLSTSIFGSEHLRDFAQHIRSYVALKAMAAGVPAIDTVSPDLEAGDDLQRHIDDARSAGMTAKFSIDPRQIEAINSGFSPSKDEIDRAQAILRACESDDNGQSNRIEHGGLIITPPMQKKAARILAFAKHHGLVPES